jgi:hypothetical protein
MQTDDVVNMKEDEYPIKSQYDGPLTGAITKYFFLRSSNISPGMGVRGIISRK